MPGDHSIVEGVLREQLSALVSRKKIYSVLGTYTPETLANYDYQDKGIKGRVRIGRKIFYPRDEVIKWISERLSVEG
jgi:hypothetical protein